MFGMCKALQDATLVSLSDLGYNPLSNMFGVLFTCEVSHDSCVECVCCLVLLVGGVSHPCDRNCIFSV